ncbi:MAG: SMC family ATPase, partial [Chloroflexi bacterium]|nr:SMC family ATPase [Chloroflexota bacterium]
KQILGEILGLTIYDDYEEKARQMVKRLEEESLRLGGEIGSIEQEIKQKPQHEAELARLEREFAQVDTNLQGAETILRQLRDEKRELDLKAKQAAEMEARLMSLRRELQQAESDAAAKRATIASYSARVSDGKRIEDGYARWQELRAHNDKLNELLKKSVKLTAEQSQLEQVVREARQVLEFELRTSEDRLAALDDQIADAEALVPELERARQSLEVLEAKEAQREQLREERESLNTQITELRVSNQQLRAHMDSLKEKTDMLQGASAACPLCGQPISAQEAARLRADYFMEGKRAGETYRANTEAVNQYTFQVEQLRQNISRLEQDLRQKAPLHAHEARLSDMMARADAAHAEREGLLTKAEQMRATLAQKRYAAEPQARLAKIGKQLTALGYVPEDHDGVRRELGELQVYEQEQALLHSARERLEAEREVLRHLEANVARTRQLIASDEAHWLQLKGEVQRLDDVTRQVQEQQRQVNEWQGRAAVLNRQLGAARQYVEHAKQMEVALVGKRQALNDMQHERGLHEELRLAFGKKGVQAMLIEAAIPEIEGEANALLNQMTDGRMQVRFETQRAKVSAKPGDSATIETLDIVISDELGPRNYEMFSGGEAFRVNFAVRIALSKLLARRAGARLQTLVIDEGFGTQDAQGRERLVEAINTVRDQFERILVIT